MLFRFDLLPTNGGYRAICCTDIKGGRGERGGEVDDEADEKLKGSEKGRLGPFRIR